MKVIVNNLEKEEVIDWNKVQLVVGQGGTKVLISFGEDNGSEIFCGTDLESGIYNKGWNKSAFKPFHGSITLQND